MPVALRALLESGESFDDPSEDLLLMLLEDIEDGSGSWLIVERIADAFGQTYVQCQRQADGTHQVEHRDGSAQRHFAVTSPGFRDAHTILTAWAFDPPAWRDRRWRRVMV